MDLFELAFYFLLLLMMGISYTSFLGLLLYGISPHYFKQLLQLNLRFARIFFVVFLLVIAFLMFLVVLVMGVGFFELLGELLIWRPSLSMAALYVLLVMLKGYDLLLLRTLFLALLMLLLVHALGNVFYKGTIGKDFFLSGAIYLLALMMIHLFFYKGHSSAQKEKEPPLRLPE
jgi:hypothetical protein